MVNRLCASSVRALVTATRASGCVPRPLWKWIRPAPGVSQPAATNVGTCRSVVMSRMTRRTPAAAKLPWREAETPGLEVYTDVDYREQLAIWGGILNVLDRRHAAPCSHRSGDGTGQARTKHSANDRQGPRISLDRLCEAVTHGFFDRVSRGQAIRTAAKYSRNAVATTRLQHRARRNPHLLAGLEHRCPDELSQRQRFGEARSRVEKQTVRVNSIGLAPKRSGACKLWGGVARVHNSSAQSLPSWPRPSHASASAPCRSERRWTTSSARGRTAAQTGMPTWSSPVTSARRVTPMAFMAGRARRQVSRGGTTR